jgi:hypothetical protein
VPPPAIDVLLPVHDALATLPEAVEDVLAQEGVALRLLAVRDTHGTGRDDGSGAWLAERAVRDPRLVVLESEGSGLTDALVTGLAACEAPLVSMMESDDRCPPHRLRTLQAALLGSEACGAPGTLAGVVSRVEPFGEITGGMRRYLAWQNDLLDGAAMAAERFVEIPALHQTGLYHREALEGLGGYATAGAWPADIDLWLRWFEAGLPLAKVPEALYRWRLHGGQSTKGGGHHGAEALRAARLHYLARLHGSEGREPRTLRLVSTGRTLQTWEAALRSGPFALAGTHAWRPGDPAPPAPADGELLLAVYGMAPARAALRAAWGPDATSAPALLFAG